MKALSKIELIYTPTNDLDAVNKKYIDDALKNFKTYIAGTTAPTDVKALWLDTTNISNPILKYYNGTDWVALSGKGGGYVVQTTQPDDTDILWFDNTKPTDVILKYYDGTSWQPYSSAKDVWVAQSTAPTDTTLLWVDTSSTDLSLKYYDGTSWTKLSNTSGFVVSSTAPGDTKQLWLDSSKNTIKYNNGSVWQEAIYSFEEGTVPNDNVNSKSKLFVSYGNGTLENPILMYYSDMLNKWTTIGKQLYWSTSAPKDTRALWVDTTDEENLQFKLYSDFEEDWILINGSARTIYVADVTPPDDKKVLWIDTNTLTIKYYDSVNSKWADGSSIKISPDKDNNIEMRTNGLYATSGQSVVFGIKEW